MYCIECVDLYCINFGILFIGLESISEVDHLDLINFYTQLFLFYFFTAISFQFLLRLNIFELLLFTHVLYLFTHVLYLWTDVLYLWTHVLYLWRDVLYLWRDLLMRYGRLDIKDVVSFKSVDKRQTLLLTIIEFKVEIEQKC